MLKRQAICLNEDSVAVAYISPTGLQGLLIDVCFHGVGSSTAINPLVAHAFASTGEQMLSLLILVDSAAAAWGKGEQAGASGMDPMSHRPRACRM
jgi:hypothetical protein